MTLFLKLIKFVAAGAGKPGKSSNNEAFFVDQSSTFQRGEISSDAFRVDC